ncbi:hypothetical protein QBC38DRAFT_76476 [Podospora fimiseda]|uniref:Methyltransferase type 11 domain-containing protein n=1 Tax=Podospora fimiseda TaxID=252190 RepID=A0AAN7GYP3_9PEZI|nr:hypothetical protein QBC38DRAFT_76476 [Podospora fimiseda]
MEFLAGYAAAKAPFSSYTVEPHHPQSQRSNRPGRSNSTSGTTTKKRSRIQGHARTNSASTSSSGRTENHQAPAHNAVWQQQQQQQQQQTQNPQQHPHSQPQHPGDLSASGPGVDATSAPASASASASATTSSRATPSIDHHHHHHHRLRHPRREIPRERGPASIYYQDKQLPATPRLNTHEAASRHFAGSTPSDPASARTTASASATTPTTSSLDRRMPQHAAMYQDGGINPKSSGTISLPRTESVTSVSGATTASGRTVLSSHQASACDSGTNQLRSFVVRNGRTYIADSTIPYPLPVDLEELHRQSLKTMLLLELYGKPICAPQFANKPPARILEVGCGTGFWSMMCYRYYEARGQHKNVSFTGLDIVPLAPSTGGPGEAIKTPFGTAAAIDTRPDKDMNWRFVQHDMRKLPFPFPDGSFDLVMVKDLGLATSMAMQQGLVEEYIRLVRPGGTVEIWETDHTLRMLRPHVPETPTPREGGDDEDGSNSEDEQRGVGALGAYNITANTPLSQPLNNYLVDYNGWISRALEARDLFCMPCTVLGPLLVQEAEILKGVGSIRLAIPLSEVRWEREGVGGVVTKDGKSYIESKARKLGKDGMPVGGKALEPAAAAVRRTALTVVVQQIQSLEHILREVSGKSQDEWDAWVGKMTNDLVRENGTSWGECLEVGAWWAQKVAQKVVPEE